MRRLKQSWRGIHIGHLRYKTHTRPLQIRVVSLSELVFVPLTRWTLWVWDCHCVPIAVGVLLPVCLFACFWLAGCYILDLLQEMIQISLKKYKRPGLMAECQKVKSDLLSVLKQGCGDGLAMQNYLFVNFFFLHVAQISSIWSVAAFLWRRKKSIFIS